MTWRVGSGTDIRVYEDNWLPRPKEADLVSSVVSIVRISQLGSLTNWVSMKLSQGIR